MPHLFAFIALSLCSLLFGCGGSSTSSNNSAVNEPQSITTKIVDMTQNKLLSDTELATTPFASLSPPSPDEANWLQAHHKKLRSLTYDKDFSDLDFLQEELKGKRIVQLGESSHGTREFNQIKVRLIKYLHERLGYNVIAFEASTIGCYLHDQRLSETNETSETAVSRSCIYGVWHSKEVQALFDYIASTRKTSRPLILAGFDIKGSSQYDAKESVFPWLLSELSRMTNETKNEVVPLLNEIDALERLSKDCYKANPGQDCQHFKSSFQKKAAELELLRQDYQTYLEQLGDKATRQHFMALLTLSSLHARLFVAADAYQTVARYPSRDRGMADNLTQIAKHVYPQEKIMVWAHNAHITKNPPKFGQADSMGQFLHDSWQDQLYTIGLFMLRGETAKNDRTMVSVLPPQNDSLEKYASSLQLAALFLPIPNTNQASLGDDWMHRETNQYVWGSILTRDTLSRAYNALIVIDHSSRPEYQ